MRKKLIITAVLASVMVMCFAQKPPQDHVLQHGELLRHHRRPRNQRRRVPSRRCEAVEYGQVRQETPQHGARVVRHRRHRPQLSGGDRRLGDREPLDPGRHRIDAQAPSGTLCDLPLRLARPARRGRGVPLPSGCLQNSKAAPTSPCGSPRCPTGARAAS